MRKSATNAFLSWLWFAAIAAVLWSGFTLRFEDLDTRPVHADEATGAKITADRMSGKGGRFDPSHFHGPLLGDLAAPMCRLCGEDHWKSMRAATLRLLPAISGLLLCLTPWWICRNAGRWPPVLAAACIATSPLLLFYSRMFIHEMLLTLFAVVAIAAARSSGRWVRHVLPGAAVGAMFATKETFAITIIAWSLAVIAVFPKTALFPRVLLSWLRTHVLVLTMNSITAAAIASWCYSSGWSNPIGVIDAIKTFFVYQTGSGHEKPASYYFDLMVSPHHTLGWWWSEATVLIFALIAWLRLEWKLLRNSKNLAKSLEENSARLTARFLGVSAIGHFLIYSLISYKTPWLMCLPWVHFCFLAGYFWDKNRRPTGAAFAAGFIILSLAYQSRQAWLAAFRFPIDARNRLAYVPTRQDVALLEIWLRQLRDRAVLHGLDFNIAVVGSDYWPLPWYLRAFPHVGYWAKPPPNLTQYTVVIATIDVADSVTSQLDDSHVIVPRGLRESVPIQVGIRKDCWDLWMRPLNPPTPP